jgi:hypothetical protein
MAYKHTNSKGVTYYLNAKEVTLDLPDDRTVNENPRNGFLTLKRKA